MRLLEIFDKGPGGGIRRYVEETTALWRSEGADVSWLRLKLPTDSNATEPNILDLAQNVGDQKKQAQKMLGDLKPDIVHLHAGFTTTPTWLIKYLTGIFPTVGFFHDVSPVCFNGTRLDRLTGLECDRVCGWRCWTNACYIPEASRRFPRFLARSVRRHRNLHLWFKLGKIVVPSRYLGTLVARHEPHGAAVVSAFTRANTTRHKPEILNPPVFLYVGRLVRSKGLEDLFLALKQIVDLQWHCQVIGEGPDRYFFERQVEEQVLSQRVTFHGYCLPEKLPEHFVQARCLVFPSRMPESFGLIGIEALSYGCPVVGYPAGGAMEWLRDGECALSVASGDVGSLARALRKAASDPVMMRRLGKAGQNLVIREFSPDSYLEAMTEVHQEAAARFNGKGGA